MGYDKQGRGIIIWMDSLSFDYFYYALVGADGSIVTPAMLFRQAGVGDSLTLSTTGQGVAYYEPITINYLPVVRR